MHDGLPSARMAATRFAVINASSARTGVTATLDEDHRLKLTANDGRNIEVIVLGNATRLGLSAAAGIEVYGGRLALESEQTFFVDGSSVEKIGFDGPTIVPRLRADGMDNLRSIINDATPQTGVSASLDQNNRLVLTAPDGRNIEVTVSDMDASLITGLMTTVGTGRLVLESPDPFSLESANNSLDKLGFARPFQLAGAVRLDGSDTLRTLINSASDRTGVVASVDASGRLNLWAPDGRNIEIDVIGEAWRVGFDEGLQHASGRVHLSSEKAFGLTGTEDGLNHMGFPNGSKTYGDTDLDTRDYLFCPEPSDYETARTHCQNIGGVLVGVDSAEETHWLIQTAHEQGIESAWIGHMRQENQWQREDGSVRRFQSFDPESADGDCAQIHGDSA